MQKLRILIADDDENDFLLVSDLLRRGLPEVDLVLDQARTANEATVLLTTSHYDLLLIDYRLGPDNGLELLQKLRRQGLPAPVVFISDQGDEQVAILAMKAGATDYLPKSKLSEAALRLAVRYALNLKKKDNVLRHAREAMRASEERFRALVENSSDVLTLIDRNGIVLYQSRAGERILGYSSEQVSGRAAAGFLHPEDRPAVIRAMRRGLARRGQPFTLEYRVAAPAGRYIDVEATCVNHLEHPAVHAIVLNQRDISERKRAMEMRAISEERYRTLFERNLAGVFRASPAGELIECNDSFARIFGFASRQEAAGVSIRTLYAGPEHGERVAEDMEHDPVVLNRESRVRKRDGSEAWVLSNSTLLRDGEGRPIAIEGTVLDITESRNLARQLLQAQKMEAIGQLAGGVAHDFNNVLMVISSYAEFVRDETEGDAQVEKGRLRRHADSILSATRRAASLTRQLLAFSRNQVMSPRVLRLNSVLEETGKMLPRLLGEQIRVSLVLSPEAGNVLADPAQIEQVIMNLAVNARDAMPRGGQLTIHTARAVFGDWPGPAPAPLKPGEYVMLSVTDTGEGIAPGALPHIFEPFFTTKERGKGTGLGLSTVYGIVRQSGGHVFVSSDPGKGTTFRAYLPRLEESETAEQMASMTAECEVRGSETILLVEDEDSLREAAAEFLHAKGFTVLAARDAAQALEIFKAHRDQIHIVVTDVIMPGRTGPELIADLVVARPELRVIFMSGYAEQMPPEQALQNGRATFLQKPFSLATLAHAVRRTLDEAPVLKRAAVA